MRPAASVSLGSRKRPNERNFYAFDVVSHKHLCATAIAVEDRFIDAMVIVVATSHVAMLERDDVAVRRGGNLLGQSKHVLEHA